MLKPWVGIAALGVSLALGFTLMSLDALDGASAFAIPIAIMALATAAIASIPASLGIRGLNVVSICIAIGLAWALGAWLPGALGLIDSHPSGTADLNETGQLIVASFIFGSLGLATGILAVVVLVTASIARRKATDS